MQIYIIVLCAFVALTHAQEIRFSLAARDIKSKDAIWGPPDPSVRIGYAIGSNGFSKAGETSVLHTKNPVWPQVFSFQFVAHLDQRLQFEIVENDALFDDIYGTVVIPLKDLVSVTVGGVLEKDFGYGVLLINRLV